MLKIALVGTGSIGRTHLHEWSGISQAQVAGIVSRECNQQQDIPYFSSLEELLEKVEVDVVDICVPTYLHLDYVKTAAQAGKHVICEKPLGLNTSEARDIIETCEKNNVRLFVGYVLRFNPEYADARQQVLEGAIGTPGVVRLSRKGYYPQGIHDWYRDEKKSGGIFLDLGIHDFDWLRWTFGDVERVIARRVKKAEAEGEAPLEYGLLTLRMASGVIAHVELSWVAPEFQATFELAGSKGMLTYDSKEHVPVSVHTFNQHESERKDVAIPDSFLETGPFRRELEHFVNCLLNNTAPLVTGDDAVQAAAIAEAATRSAADGQPVELIKRGDSE